MSQWKTDDENCPWRNYSTGTEACDVIERSPFDSLHFVGDSLIRNMFYALLMILTDDPVSGAWSRKMSEDLKSYCQAEKFFFFKCKGVIRSLEELEKPEKLCGGRKANFSINATISYGDHLQEPLKRLFERLSGRYGSVVLIHVGLHLKMNADTVIEKYLKPMLAIRNGFYRNRRQVVTEDTKWPKIFFVPPLHSGLRKPKKYLNTLYPKKVSQFAEQMQDFCHENDITFFDVRPFSRFVHSFDGTHYGLGVNFMKNQLLLNYFNSLEN